jgi:hypothetical protein
MSTNDTRYQDEAKYTSPEWAAGGTIRTLVRDNTLPLVEEKKGGSVVGMKNGCFAHSTLVMLSALLDTASDPISEALIQFKDEGYSETYMKKLYGLLSVHPPMSKLLDGQQQDAGEFCMFLLELLKFQSLSKRRVVVSNRHVITSAREEEMSIVHVVHTWKTLQSTTDLLRSHEVHGDILTSIEMRPKENLIFYIQRGKVDGSIDNTPIRIETNIGAMKLVGGVIHHGRSIHSGHYTAMLIGMDKKVYIYDGVNSMTCTYQSYADTLETKATLLCYRTLE